MSVLCAPQHERAYTAASKPQSLAQTKRGKKKGTALAVNTLHIDQRKRAVAGPAWVVAAADCFCFTPA
eukprot:1155620-Pelagomonas_calceolata.AAC.17